MAKIICAKCKKEKENYYPCVNCKSTKIINSPNPAQLAIALRQIFKNK